MDRAQGAAGLRHRLHPLARQAGEPAAAAGAEQGHQGVLGQGHAERRQARQLHPAQEGRGPGEGHHQRGRGGGEAEAGARGQDMGTNDLLALGCHPGRADRDGQHCQRLDPGGGQGEEEGAAGNQDGDGSPLRRRAFHETRGHHRTLAQGDTS